MSTVGITWSVEFFFVDPTETWCEIWFDRQKILAWTATSTVDSCVNLLLLVHRGPLTMSTSNKLWMPLEEEDALEAFEKSSVGVSKQKNS